MPPLYKEIASLELNEGRSRFQFNSSEESRWFVCTVSIGCPQYPSELGHWGADICFQHMNGIPALFKFCTQSLGWVLNNYSELHWSLNEYRIALLWHKIPGPFLHVGIFTLVTIWIHTFSFIYSGIVSRVCFPVWDKHHHVSLSSCTHN